MSSDEEQRVPGTGEQEPLLGRAGDASQQEGKPLYYNFIIGMPYNRWESRNAIADHYIGTGVVAQAGAWIVSASLHPSLKHADFDSLPPLYGVRSSLQTSRCSRHILYVLLPSRGYPETDSSSQLLNSAAVLFFIQGILVLQPTHTKEQKQYGTYWHAGLNNVALLSAIAGLVIIEYNKIDHGGVHFESPHAILGLVTYILIALQAFIGATQYFLPGLYGGEDNAKALYKYHRVSGYVILLLLLATVCAATQTTFNVNMLHMQLWAVIVASVITVIGIAPRIKKQKFGF